MIARAYGGCHLGCGRRRGRRPRRGPAAELHRNRSDDWFRPVYERFAAEPQVEPHWRAQASARLSMPSICRCGRGGNVPRALQSSGRTSWTFAVQKA